MENKVIKNRDVLFFIIWILSVILLRVLVFPMCSLDLINYDSSYQYFLVQHDWKKMMELIPQDYSPPLYSIFLKIFISVFGDSLYMMRVFSLVILSGMFLLALFPVRAAFGETVSVLTNLLFLVSGINVFFIHEIRPTVFAYFTVTGAGIYAYLSFFKPKKRYHVAFVIFAIMSMYTHNVAMVAMFATYVLLIISCIVSKQYKKLKNYFISGAICGVLYLPWLFVVLRQINSVKEHYWREDNYNIGKIINAAICKSFDDYGINISSDILKIIFVIMIMERIIKIIRKGNKYTFSDTKKIITDNYLKIGKILFLSSLVVLPICMYMIFAILVHPALADRYFNIFLGITGLIAILIFVNTNKKIAPILFSIVLVVNFGFLKKNYESFIEGSDMMNIKTDLISENDENIAFVHSHEYSIGILSYYFPHAKHYVFDETWTVLNTFDVFKCQLIDIGEFQNIKQYEDAFYFASGFSVFEGKKRIEKYIENSSEYDVEFINKYTSAYSYSSMLDLYKVILN